MKVSYHLSDSELRKINPKIRYISHHCKLDIPIPKMSNMSFQGGIVKAIIYLYLWNGTNQNQKAKWSSCTLLLLCEVLCSNNRSSTQTGLQINYFSCPLKLYCHIFFLETNHLYNTNSIFKLWHVSMLWKSEDETLLNTQALYCCNR